jgi:hypothetical protein
MRSARFGLVSLLAVATSCDETASGEAARVSVDTVAGVEHIRNAAGSPLWAVDEVTRIASPEGPASFGRISSVIADERGNVYVADQQASEIRVFDERGAHLRTIGRRGQGPSEFVSLYSLAWMGDTLMVLDPGNGRIGLLSPSGEWRGQFPHDRLTGSDLHLVPAGNDIYTLGVGGRTADGRRESHYVRFTGATMDTIPYRRIPSDPSRPTTAICQRAADGSMTFFSAPFMDRNLYEPAPGRLIAIANTRSYRIALVDSVGDTVRVIEKAGAALPITDAEWDAGTSELPAWRERFPDAQCDRTSFARPAAKPVFEDLFFDGAGRMWVEVTAAAGSAFDVFDERGRQVGRVAVPARLRRVPPYATADRVYIVLADSLGVEEVRGFRLGR